MECIIKIAITSIYACCVDEYLFVETGNRSIRAAVIEFLDQNKIKREGCSVIFRNITEELNRCSLVEFINNETYEDLLDTPIVNLASIFNLKKLELNIEIGGLGGQVCEQKGIHYYIRSRDEHLPKHVHCIKQNKECKCYFDPIEIEDKQNGNTVFNNKDKKRIVEFVEKHIDLLNEKWDQLNCNLR